MTQSCGCPDDRHTAGCPAKLDGPTPEPGVCMGHKARVSSRSAESGDDATDWTLSIGDVVTVVGFVGDRGSVHAVVVDRGVYIIVPYWVLDPLVEQLVPA